MENKAQKISRRDLLKLLTVASGALALDPYLRNISGDTSSNLGENTQTEKKKELPHFETADAIWYPIYEIHPKHEQAVHPNNISEKLDALSMEGPILSTTFVEDKAVGKTQTYKKVLQNVFQRPIESLICRITVGEDTSTSTATVQFPPATLDLLKERHLPVAFGDLFYSADLFASAFEMRAALDLRKKVGEKLLGLGAATSTFGKIARELRIDHSAIVKKVGDGLLAIGAATYLPAEYRSQLHQTIVEEVQKGKEPSKLLLRLNALSHHLTPEVLNDLFREVIQANKLMTLADNLIGAKNSKPNIGFNWHYGHKGIEDWLKVGQHITRACILAFPDEILRQIIKANNNDARCLFGIRLVQVPQSLQIIELDVSKKIFTSSHDQTEVVEDNVITDEVLKEALHQRGLC